MFESFLYWKTHKENYFDNVCCLCGKNKKNSFNLNARIETIRLIHFFTIRLYYFLWKVVSRLLVEVKTFSRENDLNNCNCTKGKLKEKW